jgi:hypothetical protein
VAAGAGIRFGLLPNAIGPARLHLSFGVKTTTFLIITGLVWFVVLFRFGVLTAKLPGGYRLPLIALSFLLVWGGASQAPLLIRSIFHPSLFFTGFYVRSGVFPPVASLVVTALGCAAGCVEYYIGFQLAQQKKAAYLWGTRATPALFIVVTFYYLLRLQPYLHGSVGDYYSCVCGTLLLGAQFLWLYRFCNNHRNQQLLNLD